MIIQLTKYHNLKRKEVYLKYVKKGDYVIDIGANVGDITLLISNIVGNKGKVFSYEALKPTFDKLLLNLKTKGFYKNVSAFNSAISDTVGEVSITVPGDDFGQASMKVHQQGSWSSLPNNTVYECSSIQLDNHISNFKKVDFIKIDIEGAELLALKGSTELIRKFRPILYVEIYKGWTKEFNYHPLDLFNYIESMGYSKFFIYTEEGTYDISNPEVQLNLDHSADLICIY